VSSGTGVLCMPVFFFGLCKRARAIYVNCGVTIFCGARLFLAEDDFAVADELVVEPQAIFEGGGFDAGAGGSAQEAHAGGGLKHVGRKGAAVDVEFDAQIAGIGNPGNLVAVVEDDGLGDHAYEYGPFSHGSVVL
jgi:hypothetical protein